VSELNRMTGYALTGLAVDPATGRLDDPRINSASPLLTGTATLCGYLDQLTGLDAAMARGLTLAADEPSRAVVHPTGPGAIPGVLVIRPVTAPSWHRVGDVLDLASIQGAPAASRLEQLSSGLWPYSAEFMDAQTGHPIGGPISAWVRATDRRGAGPRPIDDLDAAGRDALARATTGFETFEEATRRVVPSVPSSVRTLIEWGELLNDPGVLADLRPALYTWWA
jgi:hypothetical protein